MVSVIDKMVKQESELDSRLMQLALVDISSGHNEVYKLGT